MSADPVDSRMRWRVNIHLVDTSGLPAAGVQPQFAFVPSGAPVTVEAPPPTDADGNTTGYVSSSEEVCITLEVHAGGVVLLEKPFICFRSAAE